MSKNYARRRNRRGRSWGSVGNEVASQTWRATEKASESVGTWMVTDHTGLSQRLSNMPSGMGFLSTIGFILYSLLISVVVAVVQAVWIVFLLWVVIEWLF